MQVKWRANINNVIKHAGIENYDPGQIFISSSDNQSASEMTVSAG